MFGLKSGQTATSEPSLYKAGDQIDGTGLTSALMEFWLWHILVTALWWWANLNQMTSADKSPEQIHLSLGTNETEMLVTWHTISGITDTPEVRYGLEQMNLNQNAKAETVKFKDIVYTYRALMTNLVSDKLYYYEVGSKQSGWSSKYSFRTLKTGSNWNPKLCIYGDLGLVNGRSIPALKNDVKRNLYDVIFHIGDLAYDLNSNGSIGNKFMRAMEEIAAQVPYMTCPGNHEKADNFSHYDGRFSMIGDRNEPNPTKSLTSRLNNHFHSVDIGPLHIVMFSTEYYYYTDYGWEQIERQYEFLERDLAEANRNRAKRPWIIVMGHRPMYCFRLIKDKDCRSQQRRMIRTGVYYKNLEKERRFGLEELFYRYGVDLQFYGHDHYYMRLYPIYDRKVFPSKHNPNDPYYNPGAPVHILTGAAGNHEGIPFMNPSKEWVAFKIKQYCYTRLTVQDLQNLILQQFDEYGNHLDNITIFKENPMPSWLDPIYPTPTTTLDPFYHYLANTTFMLVCVVIVSLTITILYFAIVRCCTADLAGYGGTNNKSNKNNKNKNELSASSSKVQQKTKKPVRIRTTTTTTTNK